MPEAVHHQRSKGMTMKQSPALVLYPVKDFAQPKALFKQLLGTEPYVDSPYYVGFRTENIEIGLAQLGPNGQNGPIPYWDVDDIEKSIQSLLDAGAQKNEDPRDVGGGLLVGSVKDANGNLIGLRQPPTKP